jgi:hypothetical protein
MGMYSYVDNTDLTLRKGKIEEFRELSKKISTKYGGDYALRKCRNGKIDIGELFNDMKIISYWYDETLDLLDEMCEVMYGKIWLSFETGEEKAVIKFEHNRYRKDEVVISLGYAEWKYENIGTDELRRDTKNMHEAIKKAVEKDIGLTYGKP